LRIADRHSAIAAKIGSGSVGARAAMAADHLLVGECTDKADSEPVFLLGIVCSFAPSCSVRLGSRRRHALQGGPAAHLNHAPICESVSKDIWS
jgi:hypothetical protein